jgi:alpha-N-arabinofuranosidase
MYLPHRGAQAVRADFTAPSIPNPVGDTASQVGGNSYIGQLPPVKTLAGLSGSASVKGKTLNLTVVNPHLTQTMTTEIAVRGASIASAKGTELAEKDVHAHNDFAHPEAVKPRSLASLRPAGGKLTHSFPPASVTSLEITLA